MSALESHRYLVVFAFAALTALVACIDGEGNAETGQSSLFVGGPVAKPDYTAPTVPVPQQPAAGATAPAPEQPQAGAGDVPVDPAGSGQTPSEPDPETPTAGGAAPTPSGGGAAPEPIDPGTPMDPVEEPEAPTTSTAAGTLSIKFTSVDQRGRYAPRNVGAVWIETGSGQFVKTVKRWAGIRANHLTKWAGASGGWGVSFFGFGGSSPDQMDAVTGATLRTHETHDVTWNMKNVEGQVVPDGSYKVWIEVTEDNFRPGAAAGVAFDKGPSPQMVSAPDQAPWKGLTLNYQP